MSLIRSNSCCRCYCQPQIARGLCVASDRMQADAAIRAGNYGPSEKLSREAFQGVKNESIRDSGRHGR